MSEKRFAIFLTTWQENPERVIVALSMANTALASEIKVTLALQVSGVQLAVQGAAKGLSLPKFPSVGDLFETFLDLGGEILVCKPCLEARNISADILTPKAIVVTAPTFIKTILDADKVLFY